MYYPFLICHVFPPLLILTPAHKGWGYSLSLRLPGGIGGHKACGCSGFGGYPFTTVAMATLLRFSGLTVYGCLPQVDLELIIAAANIVSSFIRFAKMQMDRKAYLRVIVFLFWKQNGRHIISLMANQRVIISKRPYISLIIVSLASKYENYL